jgi:hypothetical protein
MYSFYWRIFVFLTSGLRTWLNFNIPIGGVMQKSNPSRHALFKLPVCNSAAVLQTVFLELCILTFILTQWRAS